MKKNLIVAGLGLMMCTAITACSLSPKTVIENIADNAEQINLFENQIDEVRDEIQNAGNDIEPSQNVVNTEDNFKDLDVSNNGGHFVGVDGYVYFIAPKDSSMDATGLFGEYIDMHTGEQTLVKYDPIDSETVETYTADIYGKICVSGDKLYFDEYNEIDGSTVCQYDINTGDVYKYSGHFLLGGDSQGRYVVTQYYDDGVPYEVILLDGVKCCSYEDYRFSHLIGIEDGQMVYAYYSADDDKNYIASYDIKKDTLTVLGAVPDREMDSYENYPEYEQCLIEDGKLYLSIAWYEGTGHFFAEEAYVSADLYTEESLSKVNKESMVASTEKWQATPFVVVNGQMKTAEGVPGTGYVDGSDGSYGYIAEDGDIVCLGNELITEYDDDYSMMSNCECIEFVYGEVYCVYNYLERAGWDDIGWRESYIRKGTYIFDTDDIGTEGYSYVYSIANPDWQESEPENYY